MRLVIKIGLLLVLAVLTITLGIGLAQRPADQAPSPVRSGSAVAGDAPSTKAMSSPAPPSKTTGSLPRGATATVLAPVSAAAETAPWAMGGGGMSGAPGPGMMLGPGMPGLPVGAGMMPGMPGMMPGASGMPGMPGPPGMMSGPGGGFVANSETQALLLRLQQAQAEEQALIARYAAAANDQERTQVKELLLKSIDGQFDLQQQMRQRELEPIEARVKRLRELIEKRNQARKTIVEKRLDQVLREAQGLGWTTPEAGAAGVAPLGAGGSISSGGSSRGASAAGSGSRYGGSYGASTASRSDTRRSSEGTAYFSAGATPSATPAAVAALPTSAPPAAFAPPSDDASVLGVLAGPGGDIEISLGANKGTIHKGQRLSVYRTGPDGTTRVGDVEVVEVKPDRSICKPLPEFQKGAIQKGDRVATTQLTFSAYATKPTQVKVLHAVNGDALSYAEILSVLPAVSEKKVLVVVDARTNNLVISGPKEDLAVLEALVVRLDAKAPTAPKPKSDEGKLPER